MTTWKEVTEARYWEMLGVLPPAIQTRLGFLVGEPMDHGRCTITSHIKPRFSAFAEVGGKFYECSRPMTIPEFKAIKSKAVLESV